MATAKKEVVEKQDNLPAAYDYGEYAGAGFENQSRDDYSVPFLEVLQGLSPEIEQLDSAKPGHIINKVTKDLYAGKDGIAFVPCFTQHVYVEWVPRDSGGGFVATHALDSDVVRVAKENAPRMGKIVLENGNELLETFYVFGVQVAEDGSSSQAVIAFTSTKIKKYKAWMTKARTIQIRLPNGSKINPPLFAHVYRLKTIKESNKHGEFYNWDITFNAEKAEDARLSVNSETFQEAVQVMELVKTGMAKVDYSATTRDESAEDDAVNQAAAAGGNGTSGKRPAF